jgi:hypothetical protein
LMHLPHGYDSYATWSIFWISPYPSGIKRLVGEALRSRTLVCKLPCSTCRNTGTEQVANQEAVGGGSWRWAVAFLGVQTPSKNPRPVSRKQAYIARLLGCEIPEARSRLVKGSKRAKGDARPSRFIGYSSCHVLMEWLKHRASGKNGVSRGHNQHCEPEGAGGWYSLREVPLRCCATCLMISAKRQEKHFGRRG